MKLSKLERNFTLQTAYQLVSNLIFIFTIPYITRTIGSDNIGYYSYLASICSYFVIVANLGSYAYGTREVAYCQDNREKYSIIFSEIQIFRTICSVFVLSIYTIYAILFSGDKFVLSVLALNIINVILDISWFYNGLEDFKTVVSRAFVLKILYALCIFFFVRSQDCFYIYVLIEVGFTSLISSSYWIHIRKVVDFSFKVHPFRHFKGSLALFLPAVAIQLYTVLDKTMIGIFSTSSYDQNAFYEFAQNTVRGCLVLCTSLTTVSAPKISHSIASSDLEGMRNQLYNSYTFVWFSGIPICISLFAIAPLFVPIYFGPGYEEVAVLIRILLPLIIIVGLGTVSGNQYFVPRNLMKFQILSLLSGSAVNIVLNSIFIPQYAAAGASFASVIAEASVTTMQLLFISRKGELRIRNILYSSWKYVVSGICLLVFYFYVIKYFTIVGLIKIAIVIFVGLIFYFLILLLLKDSNVIYYLKRIKKKKME